MNMSKPNSKLWVFSLLLFPILAGAQESSDSFGYSGWAQMGIENSNNVNLEEIQDASGSSDNALSVDAGLDLTSQIDGQTKLTGGYSYFGQRYGDARAFDLDMHLLYADLSREIGAATLGANYYYANADLSGDDFLTFSRPSLYLGYLASENFYLRGAFDQAEKSFAPFPQRDADNRTLSLDGYWYFSGRQSFVSVGFSNVDEDAAADRYSWEGNGIGVRYSNRFSMLEHDARLQLGLRLDDRDYSGITPAIGEPREDKRRRASAELETWLTSGFSVIGKLEQNDYESNLPSADYDELRMSIAARFAF